MGKISEIHSTVGRIASTTLVVAVAIGSFEKTRESVEPIIEDAKHREKILKVLGPIADDFCNACAEGKSLQKFLPQRDALMILAGEDPKDAKLMCQEYREGALGQLHFEQDGSYQGQERLCDRIPTPEQEKERQKAKRAEKAQIERERAKKEGGQAQKEPKKVAKQ
jgi:hypothetical protein